MAHIAKYEEIRSHAVEHQVFAGRRGLVVLLGQGLAAWIEQWSRIPTPPPSVPHIEIAGPCPLPDDASAEVVHVLTAMTLVHVQQEVHA